MHFQQSNLCGDLITKFMDRGYPKQLFMQVASTVSFEQRSRLLQQNDREPLQQNTTIFCDTHHPALHSSTISNILADDQTPFDPMVVRRRPTSIKDMVVRARVGGQQHSSGASPSTSTAPASSILPTPEHLLPAELAQLSYLITIN